MLEDRWKEYQALKCRSGGLLSMFCIRILHVFSVRNPMIASLYFRTCNRMTRALF